MNLYKEEQEIAAAKSILEDMQDSLKGKSMLAIAKIDMQEDIIAQINSLLEGVNDKRWYYGELDRVKSEIRKIIESIFH